jgi:tetratricopeptide (TPR) repeat protein
MNLRSIAGFLIPCVCALALCGCSGDGTPHSRTTATLERSADSVITEARMTLAGRPDDPDALLRCGKAMLDEVTLRENTFRNMAWRGPAVKLSYFQYIGHNPDHAEVLSPLDSLRAAASYVERALALDRENAAAWRTMGRLYMAMGNGNPKDSMYEDATAAFDTSLFLEPASAEGYFGLGCALYTRNRLPAAVYALNLSISFDSTNGPSYLTLGEALRDTGNVTVAFACFENAARLGLPHAGDYLQIARHYIDETSERRLLGRFASLRKQAPALLKPTVRAALRMGSMYHPGIAMELASRAIELDSSCAEAHLLKTHVYLDEGDTSRAVDEYMEAISLGTTFAGSYGEFPWQFLDRVSDLIPDNDAFMYILGQPGMNWFELAASPKSMARFRRAAERNPEDAVPIYLVGQAYALQHDTARAVEWFDRLTALPPEPYPAMYWRAQWTYVEAGRIDKAVDVYEKFMSDEQGGWITELFGKDKWAEGYSKEKLKRAAAYCMVGFECAWRSGPHNRREEADLAAEQFRRAIQIVPASYVPYYAMAEMYDEVKDSNDAIRYYRKAAALGSTDAADMLKQPSRGKER